MKITMIISSLSMGGAERVLVLLAKGFVNRGYHVTVITIFGEEHDFYHLPHQINRISLNADQVSKNKLEALKNNMKRLVALRKAILASNPHIVISFMDSSNILTILALLGKKVPVIISQRIDPIGVSPGKVWEILRRIAYPLATKLVSLSKGVDKYFSWMSLDKRAVIYNPLAVPDEGKEFKHVKLAEEVQSASTIVAMGRLEDQKGFDLLIKAFAKLRASYPAWKLVIMGEGNKRTELEHLINKLELGNAVQLPGKIHNPFTILKQADLFVLSSRAEGFGNVIIEAMSCGLPVISTDCPSGPNEIIRHGVDGILVPNEDIDALSEAMASLMSDEEERRRLGLRAIEVQQRFSLEKIMNDWESLINCVLRKKLLNNKYN